jgi:uncharacterized membrane protein
VGQVEIGTDAGIVIVFAKQVGTYYIPTLIAAVGSQLSAEFPATKDKNEL